MEKYVCPLCSPSSDEEGEGERDPNGGHFVIANQYIYIYIHFGSIAVALGNLLY